MDGPPFDALIGLGSNMGDKRGNIREAIRALCEAGDVCVAARSRDWRSAPWGVTDQDWFVNACIGVATSLAPRELLGRCLGIEDRMGRVRTLRWGPRLIDIDVLTYRDLVCGDPELTLPHPRITERAFVLAPLSEIAPGLVVQGRTIADWLAGADRAGLEALD